MKNRKKEEKMKNLRKMAVTTILLILVFMVIALFQFQKDDEMTLLPDQFEIFWNEGWSVFFLDSAKTTGAQLQESGITEKLIDEALAAEKGQEITLPFTGKSGAGDIVIFQNTLREEYAGLTLNFSSTDTNVRVVLDGEVIYQYETGKDTSGKLTESDEHFVNIPGVVHDGRLRIEITSPHPDAAATLDSVKIETRDVVVIGLVGNNIADIGCCLLIVIMAIIMFVLALIRWYTHQPDRGELFLGLVGLAAGIYCFIGTDTLSIFYDVQEAYEMQEYLILLLPLFLTLYFERNLHTIYPHRFSALIWLTTGNAALQILLHLLDICHLRSMVNISAAALGLICITAIVSLIQLDCKNMYYLTILSVFSMLILLAGGIANVILNTLLENPRGNAAGQYSMTLFGIIMAVMHILQISKEYRANAEEHARLLKEKVKAARQQNVQLALAKKEADAAKQDAMAANEAKGKFLAHMSHEIRTPINAVLGMDEMILRETKDPTIKEYAMDIYLAGQTLLSLINDILDFSKIDSGKMEIVPVDYDTSSLIHDLTSMTSQRIKDKNIRFEVEIDHEIPSRLYGDDVRIRQILTNILTNAVKYTAEGTIWLRIRNHTTEDTAVLSIEVEDTGIGIKEEDLPKLSAEFERIEEDRNRNIEGTGLGMNITTRLLALLGSRLHVESTYGKGSKFYFTLKQKIMDPTPIGNFESRIHQITENYNYRTALCAPDASILVVDDNAVNRKVLRSLLKETQIQITDAESGMKCLELVEKKHFDLIFLDHMMPEMDGVETLHRIRKLPACPCHNTPIVVLTANAVSGAKEKYFAEGFDGFLSKPIVPEKLENMIQQMLPDELQRKTWTDNTASGDSNTILPPDDGMGMPENLPFVDGLDWQYAWLHLPDTELLAYTVKEFYAQIDSAADRLQQAFHLAAEQGQLDQYRIQVHAMKSLASTIGIISLSGLAKILEYAAKDGKIELILSMTTPFLEEWRSYRQKLQGVFGIQAAAGKEITDPSVIRALVEMVRIGMQEMDIDQADQAVSQLLAYEYPPETEQNIRRLSEAVTNLDPKETERLASLLMKQIER